MSVDRQHRLYEPNFDVDYERGMQGQLFVEDIREAIASGRVEVKTDDRALETGNLFVESHCRRRGRGYVPSGINTTEADVWIFVVGSMAIAIPTVVLRDIYQELRSVTARQVQCTRGSHPTTGVLVPIRELRALVA